MKVLVSSVLFFLLGLNLLSAQTDLLASARDLNPTEDYENIHVQKLYSDELASSFVIWIKESVRLHQHAVHTEHVYILAGKATMRLGEETLEVRKGDVVMIPPGTPHAVEVKGKLLKVLSVQSPEFKGKDRIFLD